MAVLLGVGLAAGVPVGVMAAFVVTAAQPGLVLAGVAAHVLISGARHRRIDIETSVLAAIAGELRSGKSLRQALSRGTSSLDHPMRQVARLAVFGVPLSSLAPHIRDALPVSSALVVPAIGMLESSGGSAASVFELLAESHAIRVSLEAEQRAALAPARLSATVLLLLAAGAMAWMLASGRIEMLLMDSLGGALAVAGLVFIGAGLAGFALILRRGQEQ